MPDHRRKGDKKALTVRLDPAVIGRLKAVARDAAGRPVFATVSGMVEAGIIAECDRVEAILDAAIIDPTTAQDNTSVRRVTTINNTKVCGPQRR